VVFLLKPVFAKVVTLAPTVAILAKLVHVEPLQRSMVKPVSLPALSAHARLIWLLETAVAVRFVGAAGGAGAASVTAVAVLE